METRIVINGREYRSVDEMPVDVRRQYERAMATLADRDGNGVPDVFEGKARPPQSPDGRVTILQRSSRYVVNGREYDRLEDVPAEVRAVLQTKHSSAALPPTRTPTDGGGITIHLSWSTLLALLAAAALTAMIVWLAS